MTIILKLKIKTQKSQKKYGQNFLNNDNIKSLKIICGLKCYESNFAMSLNIQDEVINRDFEFIDVLAIDELVKEMTGVQREKNNEEEAD